MTTKEQDQTKERKEIPAWDEEIDHTLEPDESDEWEDTCIACGQYPWECPALFECRYINRITV